MWWNKPSTDHRRHLTAIAELMAADIEASAALRRKIEELGVGLTQLTASLNAITERRRMADRRADLEGRPSQGIN